MSSSECPPTEEEQPPPSKNVPKNVVVVLAGPTAVGKSDVAAKLCALSNEQPGMIVSADSVQAYRGVLIGANKPTPEERQQTPHLLVDVVDHTTDNYNAAEWRRDALHVIDRLLNGDDDPMTAASSDPDLSTNKDRLKQIDKAISDARQSKRCDASTPILPVVVGGTMMYLQWLVHGRPDAAKPSPRAVQQAHEQIAAFQEEDDFEGAVEHVRQHGPVFAQRISKLCGRDWYRLRRTLEIALTAQDYEGQHRQPTEGNDRDAFIEQLFTGQREGSLESYGYDVRCFFLCPDDRMAHTELVDERCEVMISRGLLRETTDLQLTGQLPDMAARAIGYRQTLDYLQREGAKDEDEDSFQEYLNHFTTATRRYSKKQMQWFRKDGKFVFVPVAIKEAKEKRVKEAAETIKELIRLPRAEFESQCFSQDSVSCKTMKDNEAQGKGMKFYQFKRYHLKAGTSELAEALVEADLCTNQIQAKKRLTNESPETGV